MGGAPFRVKARSLREIVKHLWIDGRRVRLGKKVQREPFVWQEAPPTEKRRP